jgi:hypothetical protein
MPGVEKEAQRRGVALTILPTTEACALLSHLGEDEANAVLHVTC